MATINYTVVAGDTLNKIAKKFGVSKSEIMQLNPIIQNENEIKVGWILKIPQPDNDNGRQAVTSYSIVVNVSGGAARRSNSEVDPDRVDTGEYNVTFPEDVSAWLWQATLGAANDADQDAASITAELGYMNSPDIIKVRTFDTAGMSYNHPFHLHVREI